MEQNSRHTNSTVSGYIIAFIGGAAAIFLDQLTKYLAVVYLKDNPSFVLIDGVFEFRYLENRGAAFGMMQNMQYFFVAGSCDYLYCYRISLREDAAYGQIYSTTDLRCPFMCGCSWKYDRPG